MPFDPNLPLNNVQVQATVLRNQFNGIKDIIDAKETITSVQIDAVNTLNPGDAATASLTLSGSVLHLTLGIPRGNDGATGATGATGGPGNDGGQGIPGIPGPPGQPFAIATVDSVTTLPPGSPATASASFDGSTVHLTFGLPSGNQGEPGTNGGNGQDGAQGIQGPPGEVTYATLATAIQGTSNNTNGVATLDIPFTNDPPTLADFETMRAAYNALVLALRR